VDFLKEKKVALLADEMGLGKSVQVIKALDYYNLKNSVSGCVARVLVVCPAIVRRNWLNEFRTWSETGIEPSVLENRADFEKWDLRSAIVSYDGASHPQLQGRYFTHLVLDECHYLKSPTAVRTKAILGKEGICHKSSRIWALSGTPMPNHAGELWTTLYTFGRTKMSYGSFVSKFCITDGGKNKFTRGRPIILGSNPKTRGELQKLLQPIFLRRKASDELKLPPIRFGDVYVKKPNTLPPDLLSELDVAKLKEEKLFMQRLVRSAEFKDEEKAVQLLPTLAQSVATLRRYTGLMKVESLCELVTEEFENQVYGKIVIFAVHRAVVEGIRKRLIMLDPVIITGESHPAARDWALERFAVNRGPNRSDILIANVKAAGIGVNMTHCNQVLFAEQDWTPSVNEQALKRCHRLGQQQSVFVRRAILDDSLDARIVKVLWKKTNEIQLTLDKNHNNP
jgi:SNF2 family DNA or RNA helicase